MSGEKMARLVRVNNESMVHGEDFPLTKKEESVTEGEAYGSTFVNPPYALQIHCLYPIEVCHLIPSRTGFWGLFVCLLVFFTL